MADRKEPTLSGIRPEHDEIRSGAAKANRPTGGAPRQGQRPPQPKYREAKPSSSPLAMIALVVALLGVGAGGFSFWKLQESEVARTDAERRIVELEGRLNLSNSESDQSVTRILERVDKAEEQYDLLWANYRTHRDGIAQSNDSVKRLDGSVKTAATDAKAAKVLAEGHESKISSLQSKTSEQQLLLTRVSENNGNAQTRLQQVDQLAKQLEATVNELAATSASNEEAIKAIDAFRRSANNDIQQLKQRLGTP